MQCTIPWLAFGWGIYNCHLSDAMHHTMACLWLGYLYLPPVRCNAPYHGLPLVWVSKIATCQMQCTIPWLAFGWGIQNCRLSDAMHHTMACLWLEYLKLPLVRCNAPYHGLPLVEVSKIATFQMQWLTMAYIWLRYPKFPPFRCNAWLAFGWGI